ncbi:hypothetical protein BJY01DRAFT_212362 [Aspergillus pseudoustus]|uniref:Secreted protein n=1 Tax=Aspergillus pseudoustus TaxID=1810923 RepID=A0ABR4K6B0_9EURO
MRNLPLPYKGLRACSCSGRRVVLPQLVLMAISVAADPLDNHTGNSTPHPCSFHLESNRASFLPDSVAMKAGLDDTITRGEHANVHKWPVLYVCPES